MIAEIAYQTDWLDIVSGQLMRNAFTGGTIAAVTSGLIGYFVVVRRDTFATHALAHIGFPGATAAVLVGAPVTLGLAVFCIAGALAIGALGHDVDRREVATGTILALSTALGVLFASMAAHGSSTVTNVLFGNILSISTRQIVTFGLVSGVVLVALIVIARPLLFASVNAEVASARGVPVRALTTAFLMMLALTVAMAVQVVGTLLLFALVVTPAATALRLSARPATVVALSTGSSVASVAGGLILSAMFNLPPSFPIVTIAFAGWLLSRVR